MRLGIDRDSVQKGMDGITRWIVRLVSKGIRHGYRKRWQSQLEFQSISAIQLYKQHERYNSVIRGRAKYTAIRIREMEDFPHPIHWTRSDGRAESREREYEGESDTGKRLGQV
jgi:hypothetical protein